jgi:hypothetical protein
MTGKRLAEQAEDKLVKGKDSRFRAQNQNDKFENVQNQTLLYRKFSIAASSVNTI